MFWLVETDKQLTQLREKNFKNVFVEPIWSNENVHPYHRDIQGFYIREISYRKGFIVVLKHSETTSCGSNEVYELINSFEEIFVRDKKDFLNIVPLKQLNDLHFISPTDIPDSFPCHDFFYRQYPNIGNIGGIIPIVKHY